MTIRHLRARARTLHLHLLMRRRVRVVLWGARRFDLQAGSPADLLRARALDDAARRRRAIGSAFRAFGATARQMNESLSRVAATFAVSMRPTIEAMSRIAEAVGRADLADRQRRALTGTGIGVASVKSAATVPPSAIAARRRLEQMLEPAALERLRAAEREAARRVIEGNR